MLSRVEITNYPYRRGRVDDESRVAPGRGQGCRAYFRCSLRRATGLVVHRFRIVYWRVYHIALGNRTRTGPFILKRGHEMVLRINLHNSEASAAI